MPPKWGMIDVLGSIKNYRESIERLMPDKNLAVLETIQRKIESGKFSDATEYNPVRAIDFVKHMNCESMLYTISKWYPTVLSSTKIRMRIYAKVRVLIYMSLRGFSSLREAYMSLTDSDFVELGFTKRPSYESLREFLNDRLGNDGLKELFDAIVTEIVRLGRSYGIDIGNRVGEDATDVRALKHDSEAKYSGYYKEYGYKVDIIADLDNGTLPLDFTPLDINGNEGECLITSIESISSKGIHPTFIAVDDKYATYENIGYCGVHGIEMVYKIAKNWKYNSRGNPESIRHRYQKYHRNDDWDVNADLDFMLYYLWNHGDIEYVGAYYRNLAMHRNSIDPEEYLSRCHERSSKIEGMNGYLKSHTNLDRRPVRRGWNAFVRQVTLSLLGVVGSALIRLQNGITEGLTSLAYIT